MKIHNNIVQGTLEWHFIRKGKITGTTLSALVGTPKARQNAFWELVAERLTNGVDDGSENPRDRGHRLEDEARAAFEFKTGLTVETSGFCEREDNEFVGFSPDGLIKDKNGKYTKTLEIKCPEGKNYVKIWFTNEVPDEYWPQVMQTFIVNDDNETTYFTAYNPDIPSYPIHIIEIHRADNLDEIEKFRLIQVDVLKEIQEKLKTLVNF